MKHHQNPLDYPIYIYILIIGWSFLAALVKVLNTTTTPCLFKNTILKLITILLTASFIGITLFWLGEYYELPPLITVSLIGYGCFIGINMISLIGKAINKKIATITGIPEESLNQVNEDSETKS